jgi:hypothetical protein
VRLLLAFRRLLALLLPPAPLAEEVPLLLLLPQLVVLILAVFPPVAGLPLMLPVPPLLFAAALMLIVALVAAVLPLVVVTARVLVPKMESNPPHLAKPGSRRPGPAKAAPTLGAESPLPPIVVRKEEERVGPGFPVALLSPLPPPVDKETASPLPPLLLDKVAGAEINVGLEAVATAAVAEIPPLLEAFAESPLLFPTPLKPLKPVFPTPLKPVPLPPSFPPNPFVPFKPLSFPFPPK